MHYNQNVSFALIHQHHIRISDHQKKIIAPWLYHQGSQKILFDIGCSLFKGVDNDSASSPLMGARWFYQYFRLNSLLFDRIIAFDRAPYPSKTFWSQIPNDLMGLYTYINVPVKTRGKFNPWNRLKTIAQINDDVIINKIYYFSGTDKKNIVKQ